jgi:hypothetical protein
MVELLFFASCVSFHFGAAWRFCEVGPTATFRGQAVSFHLFTRRQICSQIRVRAYGNVGRCVVGRIPDAGVASLALFFWVVTGRASPLFYGAVLWDSQRLLNAAGQCSSV